MRIGVSSCVFGTTDTRHYDKWARPGELPEGWCWASLGAVCSIKHGNAFKSTDFSESGSIVLTPGNFTERGRLDFKNKRVVRKESHTEKEWILSNGDLLVVMTDLSQKKLILGVVAMLRHDEVVLHNQRIGLIQPFLDLITPDFIRWAMLRPTFKNYVDDTASGTLIQHTSPSKLCAGVVPWPPKDEQTAIEEIVGELLCRLRDSVETASQELEGAIAPLTRSILAKAFRGELVAQDPSDEPASLLLERIRAERAEAEAQAKPKKKAARKSTKKASS